MAHRQGTYRVVQAAAGWPAAVPRLGEVLLSCDGMRADDWIDAHVAPYVDLRRLVAARSRAALHMTNEWDGEPLWTSSRATRCTFQNAAGRARALRLVWRNPTVGLTPRQADESALAMDALPQGIRWIRAGNFAVDHGEALTKLLDDIALIGSDVDAHAVVLDTRGNNGGNSMTGSRLLRALLKERTPADDPKAHAHWRVSTVARDALQEGVQAARRLEDIDGPSLRWLEALSSGMDVAVRRGDAFLQQPDDPVENSPRPSGHPFTGRLVLLTDSFCASACLDFADLALRVPGAVHAGHPTSGDTRYMDVAVQQLPSGAALALRLKVWRGRARGDNEPLVPRFLYAGDIAQTDAVRQWLINDVVSHAPRIDRGVGDMPGTARESRRHRRIHQRPRF